MVDKSYLSKNVLNIENEGVIEYTSMLEEEPGKETSYEKSIKGSTLRSSKKKHNLQEEIIASVDEGEKRLQSFQ